jgi:hypothetical protein
MKKINRSVSLFTLSLSLALAASGGLRAANTPAAGATPPAAASPYAVMESFVGGTWIAKFPAQKDGPAIRIEMHFMWNENKQGVRFAATWFTNDQPAPYSNGMYAWNAAKQSLVIFYTDSGGSLTEGTITPEGNVLVHEMTVTSKTGSVVNARARLTKVSADVFTNEIFVQQDGAWKKVVEAKYERGG